MTGNRYGTAVIGGGFYGCFIAAFLSEAGQTVVVLEKEDSLLKRASYSNQARVHNGYHYPRNLVTAARSRANFPRFVNEFRSCIDDSFIHL
jgi:glycine/D-amino acid oxidase-like deaminating enzyme